MARKKSSKSKKTVTVVTKQSRRKNKLKKTGRKGGRPKGQGHVRSLSRLKGLTEHGLRFLQCAIASRDFPGAKSGVPDCSTGSSVVMRHRSTTSFTGTAGGLWTCLLLPTPGVASWTQNGAPGSSATYGGNAFPDYGSLFTTGQNLTQNVNAFRYIGMTFEIRPISAILNNAGMLQCARVPGISMNINPTPQISSSTTSNAFISGLYNMTNSNMAMSPAFFCGHINQGVYGWSVNNQATWQYSPLLITDGTGDVPYAESATSAPALDINANLQMLGWGNMSPMMVSIQGTNATTAWVMVVEHIIEYRTVPGSILSEAAESAPMVCDEIAIAEYLSAARSLPAFVTADENAGFWDRFLEAIAAGSAAVSPFLGQYSAIATGVSSLAMGLRTLTV
jgi:hypothetical protein